MERWRSEIGFRGGRDEQAYRPKGSAGFWKDLGFDRSERQLLPDLLCEVEIGTVGRARSHI